ncbi:hypothetical protein CMV_022544 [Castanea mollissima]|uniref:Uncharacterized protein n=1 Tax=Castanea mollissima TaxID=60419 RepID=A0A8J4QS50_9ROSI|nr:hypothetical protein CMV_022544 [Castanea mollissima]
MCIPFRSHHLPLSKTQFQKQKFLPKTPIRPETEREPHQVINDGRARACPPSGAPSSSSSIRPVLHLRRPSSVHPSSSSPIPCRPSFPFSVADSTIVHSYGTRICDCEERNEQEEARES